jgi:hypothetical protein
MKIYLDRHNCTSWIGACETCFSQHYLGEQILPNFCLLDVEDDGQPERTFVIKDRDGEEKVLVVDEENWPEVEDSWFISWKKQNELSLGDHQPEEVG